MIEYVILGFLALLCVAFLIDKARRIYNRWTEPSIESTETSPIEEENWPPVEYRDQEELQAAQKLREDLATQGYHITDAVEQGAERGLSKRRTREIIDAWTEHDMIDEEYRNEPGPGRPKRYVGNVENIETQNDEEE